MEPIEPQMDPNKNISKKLKKKRMSTKKITKEQPKITNFFVKCGDNKISNNMVSDNIEFDEPNEQPEDELLRISSQGQPKTNSRIKISKLELDEDSD